MDITVIVLLIASLQIFSWGLIAELIVKTEKENESSANKSSNKEYVSYRGTRDSYRRKGF